jgi:DNA-directed RNA polymerase subunit N (RpoN/RPB10)
MVFNITCVNCNTTIGHLYIPFIKLMNEKKKKKGNMQNNSDICEKLKVARPCCRRKLICAIPDDHFIHVVDKLTK